MGPYDVWVCCDKIWPWFRTSVSDIMYAVFVSPLSFRSLWLCFIHPFSCLIPLLSLAVLHVFVQPTALLILNVRMWWSYIWKWCHRLEVIAGIMYVLLLVVPLEPITIYLSKRSRKLKAYQWYWSHSNWLIVSSLMHSMVRILIQTSRLFL